MRWLALKLAKFLNIKILDENLVTAFLVLERVRIWDAIFQSSSVKPWVEGAKHTKIISIGDRKLEDIIFLSLPSNFPGVEKVLDTKVQNLVPRHKSLNHFQTTNNEKYLTGVK